MGKDTIYGNPETPWFTDHIDEFRTWMSKNEKDPDDPALSNGYLPIGEVDLESSFGTTDKFIIWNILSDHLDIHSIFQIQNLS